MKETETLEMQRYIDRGPEIVVCPAEHQGRVPPHRHEFIEIVYVSDGFTLPHSCGKMTMLVTGNMFFVKPGEVHSYINANHTKLYNLLFSPGALGSLKDDLSLLPGLDEMLSDEAETHENAAERLVHVSISERRGIEAVLEKLLEERNEAKVGWEVSLKANLAQLLIKYSRMYSQQYCRQINQEKNTGSGDYYGYVYKVLCYINSHYNENITMNELSAATGLSPDYMARKFKAALNMTPSEYIRKFRIAKAMELLCTTNLTVTEISDKVGFSDVSLFSRVFKQNVGVPPASYRKNT